MRNGSKKKGQPGVTNNARSASCTYLGPTHRMYACNTSSSSRISWRSKETEISHLSSIPSLSWMYWYMIYVQGQNRYILAYSYIVNAVPNPTPYIVWIRVKERNRHSVYRAHNDSAPPTAVPYACNPCRFASDQRGMILDAGLHQVWRRAHSRAGVWYSPSQICGGFQQRHRHHKIQSSLACGLKASKQGLIQVNPKGCMEDERIWKLPSFMRARWVRSLAHAWSGTPKSVC